MTTNQAKRDSIQTQDTRAASSARDFLSSILAAVSLIQDSPIPANLSELTEELRKVDVQIWNLIPTSEI